MQAARAAAALLAALGTLSTSGGSAKAVTTSVVSATSAPTTSSARARSIVKLSGWGDSHGYHLAISAGIGRSDWREITTIDPDGVDDSSWTGYQCESGDGKYAAVVLLPGSAVNTPSLREHGAFAYSVNLSTGVARPIADGVISAYFDPGCGTGDEAVFTAALGENEQATDVIRASLATGRIEQQVRVKAQLTSPVPTPSGITGVLGTRLVMIPAGASGTVRPIRMAVTNGQPYDLHPAVGGAVDFLATNFGAKSTAWQYADGKLRELGTGPREHAELLEGRADSVAETGLTRLTPSGSMLLADSKQAITIAAGRQPGTGNLRGGMRVTARPDFVPAGVPTTDRVPPTRAERPTAQTPGCAAPRLDPHVQVLQPNAARVNWASQLAEQNLLTGSTYARPADFDNTGLPGYDANSDFPAIPLDHPAGDSWDTVPRSVFDAIMAQESNWDQASWHALPGISGDPLIADYYGNGGDSISTIDYADSDCGYGVAQVTDGMQAGSTMYPAGDQTKIAVDYEENIAAGLQILEKTWNQLYADGITDNGGDPRYLENWFDAAWAYNTGIEPNGSFNTTGCTPGPGCTGADGTWGLGWANNPANPDYPANRQPFLQSSYADAAHPSDWPYEERIMGWMASPLLWDGTKDYATPAYHGGKDWPQIAPLGSFCSQAGNDCAPPAKSGQAGSCGLSDFECWWHGAVTWVSDCAATCATSSYTVGAGSSEPGVSDPHPPTCSLSSSALPTTGHGAPIVVDDLPAPLNVVGCSQSPGWSSDGTFTYTYGTDSASDPIGAIDTHQLGAGFGGHILFTHTETGAQPDLINTGTWTPHLAKTQYYDVKIHLPATGAAATDVIYQINPGDGASPWKIRVNQDQGAEVWVDLGTYGLAAGASVVLTNQSPAPADTYDVAFDAVAFLPEGGTVGVPIGGPPTVLNMPAGSNPAWINCPCTYASAGDPVDTATGYYSQSWPDLSTPGRGAPLDFTRTYSSGIADPKGPNSSAASDGPFGFGWTFSYNLHATTAKNAVVITQEDGSTVTFDRSGSSYAPSAPRYDATLTEKNGSYYYTRDGTSVFTFSAGTGRLTGETDLAGLRAGNQTKLSYNSGGELVRITDPAGRYYALTWSGGHIVRLSDSSGRVITYGYDAHGDLTDVYDAATTRKPKLLSNDRTHYAYSATTHLMTSVRQPDFYGVQRSPQPVLAMTYDSHERVVTQTNPDGAVTTFAYGPDSVLGLATGQTLVTDPAGHKTLDTYTSGLLTSQIRGYGTSDAGTWTYTYDPASLGVISVTDPDGHTTYATYDAAGHQLSSTDAADNTTSYRYNAAGQLTATIDPAGVETTNGYDQAGHVATADGMNNGTYTWGDLTSKTVTPLGQSAELGSNGTPRVTNYYYDNATDPADRTRTVDPLGHTTKTTYDRYGDVATVTDPDGNVTRNTSNALGQLVKVVSPAGGTTTYRYDALGNVIATTDPDGHVAKASYDADGNRVSSTDGDGHKTSYAYDPAGQLIATTLATGAKETTSYTADGAILATTDAADHRTSYTYNPQGQKATVTDPDGRTTSYGYDPAGNETTMTSPGGEVTHYSYDTDNRPTAISYSGGTQAPAVTSITYDPDGRVTSMTDGTGTSSRQYDAFGDLVSFSTGAGVTVGYGYDADGEVTSISYPGSGQTVSRAYDAAGQLTSLTDWNGLTTRFGYTADGQESKITYQSGVEATAVYDPADQLTSQSLKDPSQTLAALSYGRDDAGLLTFYSASGPSVPASAQTYAYTALSQVKSAAGSLNEKYSYNAAASPVLVAGTTQAYDQAGRLCWSATQPGSVNSSCAQPPSGAVTYSYNADGQRVAAGSASYTYNDTGELASASTPAGTASYTYDGSGLRASATVNSTTTEFTYDPSSGGLLAAGGVSYLYGPDGQVVEQIGRSSSSWYFDNQLGSTIALISANGSVAGAYAYDTYGTTVQHTGTVSTPLQYAGQYADDVTGFIYLRARYYDPTTAQFISADPAIATSGSAYDYAGDDPLNGTDPTGLLCLSWHCIANDGAVVTKALSQGSLGLAALAESLGQDTEPEGGELAGTPISALAEVAGSALGAISVALTCTGGGDFSDCVKETATEYFAHKAGALSPEDEEAITEWLVEATADFIDFVTGDDGNTGPQNAASPRLGPGSVPALFCRSLST